MKKNYSKATQAPRNHLNYSFFIDYHHANIENNINQRLSGTLIIKQFNQLFEQETESPISYNIEILLRKESFCKQL